MKKILFLLLLIGSIALSCLSCEKEKIDRPFAQLETELISVDEGGIDVKGKILFAPPEDEILEYGFVYGLVTDRINAFSDSIINANVWTSGTQLSGETFSDRIDGGLMKGDKFYVRAYLKSSDWVVYGSDVQFLSQGSEGMSLSGVVPDTEIAPGDIIAIRGQKIGIYKSAISLTIGNWPNVVVTSVNDTSINFQVPIHVAGKGNIIVRTKFNDDVLSVPFPAISSPIITSVSPNPITNYDIVTLKGKNFSPVRQWNEISIFVSNSTNRVLYADKTTLQFRMDYPRINSNQNIIGEVEIGFRKSNRFLLRFLPMEIIDFSPKEGKPGDTLTISGKNFFAENISFVGLDRVEEGWEIIDQSREELKVLITELPIDSLQLPMRRRIKVATSAKGDAYTSENFTYFGK